MDYLSYPPKKPGGSRQAININRLRVYIEESRNNELSYHGSTCAYCKSKASYRSIVLDKESSRLFTVAERS